MKMRDNIKRFEKYWKMGVRFVALIHFKFYWIELRAIAKILNICKSEFLIDRAFLLMDPLVTLSIDYDIPITLSTGEKI
jgi:hypothetical protein